MNLKELAFPIRLYWDLLLSSEESSIDSSLICDQIVDMKFFTLNLRDMGPQLSDSCIEILKKLKNEMITLSLTVSSQVLNDAYIKMLSGLNVNELLVDISNKNDISLIADSIEKYKNKKLIMGISFQVMEDNHMSIPDVVSDCINNDINRLVFPMQRVKSKGGCFYVNREDAKTITDSLRKINFEKMKITIHDPFLWRIFYPAVSFPGGGCQAANSMVYITPEGKVYPCPTMPMELGNLNDSPLETILSSKAKKDLVKSLHQSPDECNDCEELGGCMGGCSGRVYVLDGTISRRDPACK